MNDRTWTHAERDSTRFQRQRGHSAGCLDDPVPEELRLAINEQYCWWCGRDGWKSLAQHTSGSHGISAAVLREKAVLTKGVSICSPELRAQCQQPTQAQRENLKKAQAAPKSQTHSLSQAGKEINRQKLVRRAEVIGEEAMLAQRQMAGRKRGDLSRKPHPCSVCKAIIPRAHPITCSPACRKVVRQITGRKVLLAMRSAAGLPYRGQARPITGKGREL